MTTVRVRFTPNGTPTPGQISFALRHDEGNRPIASGRDILNGPGEWVPVPVEGADVEVRPNDPGTHYVVKVRAGNDPQQTETFTIPPNGPINFADMVRYDPKAGMAYEPDPNWWAWAKTIANVGGVPGDDAYKVALDAGFVGTKQEWLDSLVGPRGDLGPEGKTAYQLAVDNGFVGTEQEWLESLTGPQGPGATDEDISGLLSTEGTVTRTALYSTIETLGGELFAPAEESLFIPSKALDPSNGSAPQWAGVDGGNAWAWMVDDGASANNEGLTGLFTVPEHWSSVIAVEVWWFTPTTDAGNVVWSLNLFNLGHNLSLTSGGHSTLNAAPSGAGGTASRVRVTSVSSAFSVDGAKVQRILVRRLTTSASDTVTGDVGIVGLKIVGSA